MAVCDSCGNDYERAFTVTLHNGDEFTFDCFECAVHLVAPRCHHCGCRIIGHGREEEGIYYCCEHCRRRDATVGSGAHSGIGDRADGGHEA